MHYLFFLFIISSILSLDIGIIAFFPSVHTIFEKKINISLAIVFLYLKTSETIPRIGFIVDRLLCLRDDVQSRHRDELHISSDPTAA